MHKIYTYIAGAKRGYCEDALYADENCAFVIDGATGVSGEKVTDCATDAAWFSAAHRAYLAGALKGDGEIAEILKTGVREVAARYARFDGADKVKDKHKQDKREQKIHDDRGSTALPALIEHSGTADHCPSSAMRFTRFFSSSGVSMTILPHVRHRSL